MKVKIKTRDIRFSMPIPVTMAVRLIPLIPEPLLERIRRDLPHPYCQLMNRAYLKMVTQECIGVLKENKGLEIVNVQGADGTVVYIRL